jgi:hypothetical protein
VHHSEKPQGLGDILFQAQQIANAAQDGPDFAEGPFTISFRDVDIPAFIWDGAVYVQMPLEGFLDAVTAALSEVLRDLEVGISEAGRAALSYTNFRATLPRAFVAKSGVVRDSGEQR